ncbi:MAG: MlaD family protein [Methylobacter sp.]|uniref:MlaD family protein n=1 Tax=Methylobacter sp. TaxID=2051955 RepID=UPI0025898A9D|nr:MlaD family protein [Methylobacter sp.]MCL7419676.1 MlaD family protein [Methylobacter sp.]
MGKDSYALVTGLFMAVLVSISVMIIIWLGEFEHRTRTYVAATRDSVTGLKAGSTVYYRGIEVGKVSDVRFDPADPGLIIVPMAIDEAVRLKRDVYATLEMQGVTGLTRIALKDGDTGLEGFLPAGGDPGNRIPIKPSLIDRLSVSGEDTVNEAHELMGRLNRLLDENNINHVAGILANLDSAAGRLINLQDQAGKVLAEAPALMTDARRALAEVNGLSREFKQMSRQMRGELTTLSRQSSELLDTGNQAGRHLLQTTLPRADSLMLKMQATARRFDRVAATLETDPQAFLLGNEPLQPAPGEPGFKESP